MASTGLNAQDLAMKAFAASLSWFLGAWVMYDMAAFAIGMPRQATPFVAVAVAIVVWLGLRVGAAVRSTVLPETPISDPHLRPTA
ncbi:MAG TPA: hypothetical protein VE640_04250 [Candidatus Bathyarchaeia archaeon]|nr:hypothetical protein [Candidatus Bathyarchaeia archaeon]